MPVRVRPRAPDHDFPSSDIVLPHARNAVKTSVSSFTHVPRRLGSPYHVWG
jgi:hypothetical protein